ncbi:MAG: YtxH domain-containing protein [Flavobacterium sp.]
MNTGKLIAGTITGLAIGATLGILFAPEKGSVTRKKIKDKGGDYLNDCLTDLKTKFDDLKSTVKEQFENAKNDVEEQFQNAKDDVRKIAEETKTKNFNV